MIRKEDIIAFINLTFEASAHKEYRCTGINYEDVDYDFIHVRVIGNLIQSTFLIVCFVY